MNVLMGLNAPWVGGTRIHVLTLAKALIDRGHLLTLVTDGGILEDEMAAKGIPFSRRVEGLQPMLEQILKLIKREKPAVLHAHPADSILESYYVSKVTGIPFVVTMHGEYLMHFDRSKLGERIAEAVHRVIAVSDRVKGYLVDRSVLPAEKIRVVPNGIDTDEYRPGRDIARLRADMGIQADEMVVMYLGRLDSDKQKGILSTVEAIRLLARRGIKIKGIFVGTGNLLPTLTELSKLACAETGEETLLLTGFRRDLADLLSLADVVVATGRAALEAMAVGKPVLAVGRAGFLGLLSPENWEQARATNFGDHGTLPEPHPADLADWFDHLGPNPGLNGTCGEQLRELVRTHFDHRKVATEVEAVYEEAVMRSGRDGHD